VNSQKLAAHWQTDRYGAFRLTEAIRPGLALPVLPQEGFRFDFYHDRAKGLRIPMWSD
jgi:hypothetical protein